MTQLRDAIYTVSSAQRKCLPAAQLCYWLDVEAYSKQAQLHDPTRLASGGTVCWVCSLPWCKLKVHWSRGNDQSLRLSIPEVVESLNKAFGSVP